MLPSQNTFYANQLMFEMPLQAMRSPPHALLFHKESRALAFVYLRLRKIKDCKSKWIVNNNVVSFLKVCFQWRIVDSCKEGQRQHHGRVLPFNALASSHRNLTRYLEATLILFMSPVMVISCVNLTRSQGA